MLYRIIVAKGANYGRVLGAHVSDSAAGRALGKNKQEFGTGSVLLIETDERLVQGVCYPDVADQGIADHHHKSGMRLMELVIKNRATGEVPDWVIASIIDEGWTMDSLSQEFGPLVHQKMEQERREHQKRAERSAMIHAGRLWMKKEIDDHVIELPAITGTQARRQFFTVQMTLQQVDRLLTADHNDLAPEDRSQRKLNPARGKKLGGYIVGNHDSYVLPAITVCIDPDMTFDPIEGFGGAVGTLKIPVTSLVYIIDGQHRREGIRWALSAQSLRWQMQKETIAVTIYYDEGPERRQQMFCDINYPAVRVSSSLNMLYDRRNSLNHWILDILAKNQSIWGRIELDSASVGAQSSKLWAVVAMKKALLTVLGLSEVQFFTKTDENRAEMEKVVDRFFDTLAEYLPRWGMVIDPDCSAPDIRSDYIVGHAVFLQALAIVARKAQEEEGGWQKLSGLAKLDVARDSEVWEGKCVVNGRMNRSAAGANATAAEICSQIGIEMDWS